MSRFNRCGLGGARARQHGAAAVEFALIASLFFTLLLGIMEMGRVLFYWNTVTEVTRLGARLAVVCDMNDADIEKRMAKLLPQVKGHVTVSYLPTSCNVNTCQQVMVSVSPGVAIPTYIPFVPTSLKLPAFQTTLPRESMQSTFNGTANPVCQ
jgi:Flp pilus assembly protein TadG